jgi:uncharacterized membrane protein YedE/YeeE
MTTAPLPATARSPDLPVSAAAAVVLAGGCAAAAAEEGWRMASLWITGAALGAVLYAAAFGFAGAYRALLRRRRTAGVRAQLLLVGASVVLCWPALDAGTAFGQPVRPFVLPLGADVALGAFVFGIGMQIAGGCASGTLYAAGGGSIRMLVVLAAFVAAATATAAAYPAWDGLPALPAVSLPEALGLGPAIALQLAAIGLLWAALHRIERRAHGGVEPLVGPGARPALVATAALLIAALAFATLVLAGRPWAITQAFVLWGSWGAEAAGVGDPWFWPYWEEPTRVEVLSRSFWADVTSVMDVGLAVGAMLAAALAGRFAPTWRMSAGAAASAAVGGSLLGIGAVLATGCNISAFVSGVASGSLHGWLWLAAALPGNALGVLLRPKFGLDAET